MMRTSTWPSERGEGGRAIRMWKGRRTWRSGEGVVGEEGKAGAVGHLAAVGGRVQVQQTEAGGSAQVLAAVPGVQVVQAVVQQVQQA